jgi:hypothetical protein
MLLGCSDRPCCAAGQLKLRIAPDASGKWTNAEVVSHQSLGYGTYSWRIARNAAQVRGCILKAVGQS